MNEKKILSIGCGNRIYGATDYTDLFPQNSIVRQCDIDRDFLPYPSGLFDEVFSECLFEHLTNHKNYMQEVRRVLKEGGRHTIITDNAACLLYHIGADHSNYNSAFDKDDRHFALFTPGHLKNYAEKFGFEVVSTEYIWSSSTGIKRMIKELAGRLSERLMKNRIRLVMIRRK